MIKNKLFKCDNIRGMQYLLNNGMKGKVDLIYIDPPFATNRKFMLGDNFAYDNKFSLDSFLEFLKPRLELCKELLADTGSIYVHTDYKIGHYVRVLMDSVFGINNFRNDITRIKCNPKNFNRLGFGNIKDMILFYTKSKNAIFNKPMEKRKDIEKSKLFTKNR